jgi:hypothetical protein
MESYPISTMSAGIILAMGSVLAMAIITTSLRISYKEGKLNITYGGENISGNAVEIVKAVIGAIPETIKNILPIK